MNTASSRGGTRPHQLRFLPLLAATVLATTIAFTFSSFVLAELQGLLGLTKPDAMALDLLLLSPLVSLPVLLLVLRHSGWSVSAVKATVALFTGHLMAYAARSYMDDLLSGPTFPSADERTLIIAYGYLGWCVGPLVTTLLLLALSRAQPRASAPAPRYARFLREPAGDPDIPRKP